MTNSIQQSNVLPYQQAVSRFSTPLPQKGHASYTETLAQRSDANISLTTAEGDVVTISHYQEEAYSLASENWKTPLQQGMNFTASSLSANSFNLSIAGDLNEEELADIQNLLTDLSAIADHFFSGDMTKAMDEAMNIGDMGSIVQLSASFSYQAQWSATSQMTDYHPLPASENFETPLEDLFAQLPEVIDQARTDEIKYAEMLQAQWQQIKEYLDGIKPDQPSQGTAAPGETQEIPAARQMMNKLQETIAKHPRLAPFSLPLVHEAIDTKTENMQHPALFNQKNTLKENFLQEFNNWMYSV